MKPWEKWSFHILTLLVTVTGIVYFFMKYMMESDDPFSVINHPLEPHMLNLHLLAAPALVFVMGIILNSHISQKLKQKGLPNRKTGWIALIFFPVMTFSGYLLPMLTNPILSKAMLALHLASGGIFAAVYLAHQVISIRLLRRTRVCAPGIDRRLAA